MSHDGVHVGRVIDVVADGIVIEKGQFFLRDFRLAFSDISTVRGEEIVLERDYATLRRMDSDKHEGTAKGTVGVAGIAAPPSQGGLGLGPTDLTQARMGSAKFQDHGRYELGASDAEGQARPAPHEPPLVERRAAGPGWDPLSVDEADDTADTQEAPRTSGPDTDPPTRY